MTEAEVSLQSWWFLRALARHNSIRETARNEHHSESVIRRHLKSLAKACNSPVITTQDGVTQVTEAGLLLLERFAPIDDDQKHVWQRLDQLLQIQEPELFSNTTHRLNR